MKALIVGAGPSIDAQEEAIWDACLNENIKVYAALTCTNYFTRIGVSPDYYVCSDLATYRGIPKSIVYYGLIPHDGFWGKILVHSSICDSFCQALSGLDIYDDWVQSFGWGIKPDPKPYTVVFWGVHIARQKHEIQDIAICGCEMEIVNGQRYYWGKPRSGDTRSEKWDLRAEGLAKQINADWRAFSLTNCTPTGRLTCFPRQHIQKWSWEKT